MVWLLPDAHVNICGDVYVTPSTVNERPLEFVRTVTVIGFEGALPALPIMKLSILTGAGKTHPLSQQYHCEGLYVLSVAVIESLTPFFPYTSAFIVLFASTFTRSEQDDEGAGVRKKRGKRLDHGYGQYVQSFAVVLLAQRMRLPGAGQDG